MSIFDSLSSITFHLQQNVAWPTAILPQIYDLVVHSQAVFLSPHS